MRTVSLARMNKNVAAIVIVATACILVGCCGLGGFGAFAGFKGYQQAGANIDKELSPLVAQLLTSMDGDQVRAMMTESAQRDQPAAATKAAFDDYAKQYGKLTKLGPATLSNMSVNTVNNRTTEEATLTYQATFEKADGDVTVQAKKGPDHKWKLEKLTVNPAK